MIGASLRYHCVPPRRSGAASRKPSGAQSWTARRAPAIGRRRAISALQLAKEGTGWTNGGRCTEGRPPPRYRRLFRLLPAS
eukprot:1895492-Pyramimonas_sp.AAC.1